MFDKTNALKDKNSAARYFAWIISKRYVKSQGGDTSGKFWNVSPWNVYYGKQVIFAHSLLKLFSAKAIDVALNRKDCQWQYTLREKKLKLAIQEEQSIIDNHKNKIKKKIEEANDIIIEKKDVSSLPAKKIGKTNKFNRLK